MTIQARTLSPLHLVSLSLFVVATFINCVPAQAAEPTAEERLFTLRVLPIFKTKCFGCHGQDPNDVRGDFNMLTRKGLLAGGESGESSLISGQPAESPLYQAVLWETYEMPPKENDRLTHDETEFIRKWIAAGAPWPDAETQLRIQKDEWSVPETADGVVVATSGGLADDWTYRRYRPSDIWAFQPVKKVNVDQLKTPDQHPVDFFIERKLIEASFQPAPQADPRTLIRRATFDLLGLPPKPEEIDAFLTAWETNPRQAWSELIDRLLDSPHYGERWAQHWLDVTRYADTGGYSNDYERSNMWRYRDYVIRAFNQDKPYNDFIIEQIAGDEILSRQNSGMPPSSSQRSSSELLIATGFLRLGPWDPAMVKNPEARQMYLDDVVNAVGQTFLSTTMRCFKCHDHKFDPLPTRDYYRMYAAFAGTQLAERPASFLPEENLEGFQQGRAHVERLLDFARAEKQKLLDKQEAAAREWYQEHNLPYQTPAKRKNLPDEMKPPRHVGLNHIEQGQLKVREQDEWIWNRRLERYEPMVQSVYNGPDPKWLNARKLRMPGKVDQNVELVSHILTGGSLEAPGEEVQPGVLSVLDLPVASEADDPYVIGSHLEGRRLALAEWIADPANPLTSRSIVNRIWQYHFGKPIAGNPNNFGVKGAKPTHPELLDWLATDFVANGWKFKRLHKLIMTSDTYLQASHHPKLETLRTSDPNNDLLAYFPTRRLTAEELRDAMLRVTGELNPTIGGLPVMPEINMEVALQPRMIQFSLAPAYQPSPTPEVRNRRSIYAYRVRGQADPFLEVFNQPNPNESCEIRDDASVSPQAFTLMNSDLMNDRAIAFALRLESEQESLDSQVERAFETAFGRTPKQTVRDRMVDYVQRMHQYHSATKPKETTYPTTITRSLVEEFSGQPFEYDEILPAFENYVADKKASDVSPTTRALADLCLMLFNTNEFIYVY